MAEYEMNDPVAASEPTESYDIPGEAKGGVSAIEASVTGKYPKAGYPWPSAFSREVPVCPPPRMFWDLKYGAPKSADIIIFLAIMLAISTTKPEITCLGQTSEISRDDYKVGFLLTMSIVHFIYTILIMLATYVFGTTKLLVISMGAKGGMQQVLNWWMLQLSWQVVMGAMIFIAAIVAAAGTKEKNDDIDKAVSDGNCSKTDYNIGGIVFGYALAFIWCVTLNLWECYVYFKACKSDYGMPSVCGGGGGKASGYSSHEENVHAV